MPPPSTVLHVNRLPVYGDSAMPSSGLSSIVARTHFLGKAKRSLQLLQAPLVAAGDSVEQDGNALGTVASVAGDLALAVLPLETSDSKLSIRGQPARPLPFVPGLAR